MVALRNTRQEWNAVLEAENGGAHRKSERERQVVRRGYTYLVGNTVL